MEPQRTSTITIPPRAALYLTGVVLIALSFALGAWISFRGEEPFPIDVWWNTLLAEWASPFMLGFSQVMNWLGGGWFGVLAVPLGAAVALILVKRPWSAVFFLTASALSAVAVQAEKHLFGRVRPEDILVIADFGSFPSGHVANAATIATAAVFLFPRVWVTVVGVVWVLLMALSRTYLHAHWFSDTIGGMLIGAGTVLLVAGAFEALVAPEREAAVRKTASLG